MGVMGDVLYGGIEDFQNITQYELSHIWKGNVCIPRTLQ